MPIPMEQTFVAFDTHRDRFIAVDWLTGRVWEWTGNDGDFWIELTPTEGLSLDSAASDGMVYDQARKRLVLVGDPPFGQGDPDFTVVYEGKAPERPALRFVPKIPVDIDLGTVISVEVEAHCGGSGQAKGRDVEGAELVAWTTGRATTLPSAWAQLGTNEAPLDGNPEATNLEYRTASVDEERALVLDRDRKINLECRPLGTTGNDLARTAADYFEVRLRYTSE